MLTRRRLVVGTVLVACAGGVAAGLVASSGAAGTRGPTGVIARGDFKAAGWGTDGSATVVRQPSGALVLHLSKDFRTEHAPDLWAYVGHYYGLHGVYKWQYAGPMYRTWGRHTYPLHTAPKPGDSVIIFCGKCDRAFGYAPLHPVTS